MPMRATCSTDFKSCIGFTNWVFCHQRMACPQVTDGGDGLQIWRAASIQYAE